MKRNNWTWVWLAVNLSCIAVCAMLGSIFGVVLNIIAVVGEIHTLVEGRPA